MTKRKDQTGIATVEPHDPYAIRDLQQLFTLFDGGEFLADFMERHRKLLQAMQDYNDEFGHKGAKASFQISVSYELGGAGDLGMKATADFKEPKKPASAGAAYVDEQGRMTLYSPMMRKMHGGVRDVTPHDPETGEIRDV